MSTSTTHIVKPLVLLGMLIFTSTNLLGQDKQWINELGGDFHDAANWDSGVPGVSDNAFFELASVFGVDLTGDIGINSWQQTLGDVSLLGGHSLQANGVSVNGSSLTLNGLDTNLSSAGSISIGTTNGATLNVNAGTSLTSNGAFLGNTGGSIGSVFISGAGAKWTNSGLFNLDNGSLHINDGGFVSTGLSFVGNTTTSGSVLVNGAGSHWQVSSVAIATSGSGHLRIENGGRVTGSGFIGRYGTGSATVTGVGSIWDNVASGDVRVGWGSGGNGTFTIENGGQVQGRAGSIADAIGSQGTVTVNGAGSSWITSLQMAIGSQGNGLLTIENGGYASNHTGTMASTNRGTANVSVAGDGSHWNLEIGLTVGNIGVANMQIENGGLVTVGTNINNAVTNIGSNSKVTVNSGGRFEFGTMSFDSLSRVCGSGGILSGFTETVTGYNHIESFQFENLSSMDASDVRIANDGVIHGTGFMDLGLDNSANGELRAMNSDFMNIAGHSFNSGEINNFGGAIRFEKSLTNRADGFIGGRGQFSFDEGLLNEGAMAFTAGPTDIFGAVEIVAGGRVVTSGGGVTTFHDDLIHNGQEIHTAAGSQTLLLGEVSGQGVFTGEGELFVAGDLRPGNSPGILEFEGDLTLTQSAASFFELGGLADGEFDKLMVDGDLHLDGMFSVSLIDGFDLADGDEFLIAEVDGVLTGQFDGLDHGDTVASFDNMRLSISYAFGDGNDVGLITTAVPEPGVCTFMLFGALVLLPMRRRR